MENGGTVTFNASGSDTDPAGGQAYEGYTQLSRSDNNNYTCVFQQMQAPVSAGTAYQSNFSSKALSGRPLLNVLLYDSIYSVLAQSTIPIPMVIIISGCGMFVIKMRRGKDIFCKFTRV